MGTRILKSRLYQGTPVMIAASSISLEICSMELIPPREAKGVYLTPPTITSSMKEL